MSMYVFGDRGAISNIPLVDAAVTATIFWPSAIALWWELRFLSPGFAWPISI